MTRVPAAITPPPEDSQATTILVLGILGLFVPILGPVALFLAKSYFADIESSGAVPHPNATVGRILGIIGSVLLVVYILAAIAVCALLVVYLFCVFFIFVVYFVIIIVAFAAVAVSA